MSHEKRILADGRAVLYRGDNLDLLAAGLLKCDAIVSDPPYGIGFQHNGCGIGGCIKSHTVAHNLGQIAGDGAPFDPAPWVDAAPLGPKRGSYGGEPRIVLFGADHFRARLPEYGTLLAWDKHCGKGPDDNFADCEWAWCGKKVKREVFRWLWKGVIAKKTPLDRSPTKGGNGNGAARFARVHVSQKPVELMRWCIEKLKPPQDALILDPYMGSGSTGIAALSLGHRFIGVEIDPGHFETACARIESFWSGESARPTLPPSPFSLPGEPGEPSHAG